MAVNESVTVDVSGPVARMDGMIAKAPLAGAFAAEELAYELLRLSQIEVPHDKGTLQNSGTVQPGQTPGTFAIGYNMVYAARLHEHPEYKFQKGRKGKYLEDPLKLNELVFGTRAAISFGEKMLE